MAVMSLEKRFAQGWPCGLEETKCGWGATMSGSRAVRASLPAVIRGLGVRSLADVGCGDLNWIQGLRKEMPGVAYRGYDLVIRREGVTRLDILSQTPQPADLVLCRDVLTHLPTGDAALALVRLRAAGRFLAATTFPGVSNEPRHQWTGNIIAWSPVDLSTEPFDLGRPLLLIPEGTSALTPKGLVEKCLGVWDLAPLGPAPRAAAPVQPKQGLDPYGTHLPMLSRLVREMNAPVLELGSGDYSTYFLHEAVAAHRAAGHLSSCLWTCESDAAWLERYRQLGCDWHVLLHTPCWESAEFDREEFRWSVALVDHGQGDRRWQEIQRLAYKANYIVVHDTENPDYLYDKVGPSFKHAYTDRRFTPWTTVLSNYFPLDQLGDGPAEYVKVGFPPGYGG